MTENNRQYDERMIRVEDKIDLVINNHIYHLNSKVEKVDKKVDKIIWLIITTLIGIVFLLVKVVR